MAGAEVGALVGAHRPLMSEPVAVQPTAARVGLGDAGGRLFDGEDGIERLARDDRIALPFAVVREHLRKGNHVARRGEEAAARGGEDGLRLGEDKLLHAAVRRRTEGLVVGRVGADEARELFGVRRERRILHAERIEHALLEIDLVGFADRDFQAGRRRANPGVAVGERLARLEGQRTRGELPGHLAEGNVAVDHARAAAPARRVRGEVAEGERMLRFGTVLHPHVGELGQVLGHLVVERELAVVDRAHDRGAGEGLRHREDREERVGRHLPLPAFGPPYAVELDVVVGIAQHAHDAGDPFRRNVAVKHLRHIIQLIARADKGRCADGNRRREDCLGCHSRSIDQLFCILHL